jgi:spore maturation protein CgeB
MCGALYLTSYNPDLELCYDVGKEIVCYHDKGDCLAQIRRLLADPDLCDSIRQAARRKGLVRHTWELRFDDAFRRCRLIPGPGGE